MTISYDRLPEHMRDAARRYIEDRIAPGGFLTAVLENNLAEAFGRADRINSKHIGDWVHWLYWDIPSEAWGSPEAVGTWLQGDGALIAPSEGGLHGGA